MNLAQAREGIAMHEQGLAGVQSHLAIMAASAEALADCLDADAFAEVGGDVAAGRRAALYLAEECRDRAGDTPPPAGWTLPERLRTGTYGPVEAHELLAGMRDFLRLAEDVAASTRVAIEAVYAALRAEQIGGRHAREVGHLLPEVRGALRRSRRVAGPRG